MTKKILRVRGPEKVFKLTSGQKKLVYALADLEPGDEFIKKIFKRTCVKVGYAKSSGGMLWLNDKIPKVVKYIRKKIPFRIEIEEYAYSEWNKDPDSDRKPGEELSSDLMETFCREIVADTHMGVRAAARRAGYTYENMGWKLMQAPKIKERIKELKKERRDRLGAKADDVIPKLVALSSGNMADFAE